MVIRTDWPLVVSSGQTAAADSLKPVAGVQQVRGEWNEYKQRLQYGIHVASVAEIAEPATQQQQVTLNSTHINLDKISHSNAQSVHSLLGIYQHFL